LIEGEPPALIAGWGILFEGQLGTTVVLHYAETVVQPGPRCAGNIGIDETTQLCAVKPPLFGTATCEGDSGGPLLGREASGALVEIGVISSGVGTCSLPAGPDVFTRADVIAPWVGEVVAAHPPTSPSTSTPTTPAPAPPIAAAAGPPDPPGVYLTPRSRTRKVALRVSKD